MPLEYDHLLIGRAKQLRSNPTPRERKLWFDFLKDYPIRFQRQKAIGHYIVDFYCAQAGLVVELDGGGHFTPGQMDYDTGRTAELEVFHLRVLRFVNTDVEPNFYEVCTKTDETVKAFTRTAPPDARQTAGG